MDALLLRGSLYLNRGDYTKAIEDFRTVVERDPKHLFALMNLASARAKMYDYIESIEEKTSRVVGEEEKVKRTIDYSLVLEGNNKCLEIDLNLLLPCSILQTCMLRAVKYRKLSICTRKYWNWIRILPRLILTGDCFVSTRVTGVPRTWI